MQVDNALTIDAKFRVAHSLAATMPDQGALQLLVPFIVDMLQIFNEILVLV